MKKNISKFLFATLFGTFFSFYAFADAECKHCDAIKGLKQQIESSKIKPDPDNAKTIDKQNKFIDKALDIAETVLKKKPLSDIDMSRIVGLLAVVGPYDYECRIGEELYPYIKNDLDKWMAEIKRQGKAKVFSKTQMDDLLYCFANAEGVIEKGTDGE